MSKCRYNVSEDCNGNKDCLSCVLDKIKAEIEESRQCYEVSMDYGDAYREQELSWVLEVIDKYIGEDYNK